LNNIIDPVNRKIKGKENVMDRKEYEAAAAGVSSLCGIMMKVLLSLVMLSILAGCTPPMKPERFFMPDEAFPGTERIPKDHIPPDAFHRSSFATSPYNVFRAVLNAVASSGFKTTFKDQGQGIILAMSEVSEVKTNRDYIRGRRYSIAVFVNEISKKETEVIILSKVQTSCEYYSPFQALTLSTISIGIMAPFVVIQNIDCNSVSQLQWTGKQTSISGILFNIIQRTQSDLISSGII
jgi:hypothetical protein